MLQQPSGRSEDRDVVAFFGVDERSSQAADPHEGARLVRAFLRIADPSVRSAIIDMVETMGFRPANR